MIYQESIFLAFWTNTNSSTSPTNLEQKLYLQFSTATLDLALSIKISKMVSFHSLRSFIIISSLTFANVLAHPTPAYIMSDLQIQVQTAVANLFIDVTQLKGDLEQLLIRKAPSDATTIKDLAGAAQRATVDADGWVQKLYIICGGELIGQITPAAEDAGKNIVLATNATDLESPFSAYHFIMNNSNETDVGVIGNVVQKINDL
jgi:hypothetical protein